MGERTFVEGKVLRIDHEEPIEKARGDDPRITFIEAEIARSVESIWFFRRYISLTRGELCC